MQLSSLLQTLLFRDLVTYFIPGTFLVSAFILLFGNAALLSAVSGEAPLLMCVFVVLGAYAIGFLNYMLTDYARRKFNRKSRRLAKMPPDVARADFSNDDDSFGSRIGNAARFSSLAMMFCEFYVQINYPSIHYSRIERIAAMRNFRVGLAGVAFWLAILLVFFHEYLTNGYFIAGSWYGYLAVVIALFAALAYTSHAKDIELYQTIYGVYIAVRRAENIRSEKSLMSEHEKV